MRKFTKLLLISGLILAGQCLVYGQMAKITLLHNGSSTFYTNLTAALTASVNEDTIYLPGGLVYSSGDVYISKKLTIVGAGHYPDSTTGTYRTIINNNLYILTGADGGFLEGIYCANLRFGSWSTNQIVNNYIVRRCKFDNVFPTYTGGVSLSQNIQFFENVIGSFQQGDSFSSAYFEKNIIGIGNGNIYSGTSAIFSNNILRPYYIWQTTNCTYTNNIIIGQQSSISLTGSNSTFINNLFIGINSTLNVSFGNHLNVYTIPTEPASSTFVYLTSPGYSFSYTDDYHLKPTSNGHNAGTDGTDVGIYGTSVPCKEQAVPFNPHISSKNIGTTVSPTGTLSIDVKVVAQER